MREAFHLTLLALMNTLGLSCHQAPVHWNNESKKTRILTGTIRFRNPTRKWESVNVFSIANPKSFNQLRTAFG